MLNTAFLRILVSFSQVALASTQTAAGYWYKQWRRSDSHLLFITNSRLSSTMNPDTAPLICVFQTSIIRICVPFLGPASLSTKISTRYGDAQSMIQHTVVVTRRHERHMLKLSASGPAVNPQKYFSQVTSMLQSVASTWPFSRNLSSQSSVRASHVFEEISSWWKKSWPERQVRTSTPRTCGKAWPSWKGKGSANYSNHSTSAQWRKAGQNCGICLVERKGLSSFADETEGISTLPRNFLNSRLRSRDRDSRWDNHTAFRRSVRTEQKVHGGGSQRSSQRGKEKESVCMRRHHKRNSQEKYVPTLLIEDHSFLRLLRRRTSHGFVENQRTFPSLQSKAIASKPRQLPLNQSVELHVQAAKETDHAKTWQGSGRVAGHSWARLS